MRQLAAAQSPYVIFVSPLLLEAGQNVLCDRILVVDVPEETQISRTISRDDNDEAQVRRIISTQLSRQQRLEQASDVIKNNQGLAQLDEPIERLHQQYLTMAAEKDRKPIATVIELTIEGEALAVEPVNVRPSISSCNDK